MYIETTYRHNQNGSKWRRDLLRETYRDDAGNVQHRTLANFTGRPIEEIDAIKSALKAKDKSKLFSSSEIQIQQGNTVGTTLTLQHMANETFIARALGNDTQAKLALWQIFSRVLQQGSRLSSVRLANSHNACALLGLDSFNEDDLYSNLDWLAKNQDKIEDKLFKLRHPDASAVSLFLYDVTSSYLEGEKNDLAAYGYNRDKKKGKKQIVVGLLCDKEGFPVSVQVFKGNTGDTSTFSAQIQKVSNRFGIQHVTFVGDRGMIKSMQIKDLNEAHFSFITALTKPEIETLLENKSIAISIFDSDITEIESDGLRYILRRNPIRENEIKFHREQKIKAIEDTIERLNTYLRAHPRAKIEVASKRATDRISKLKVDAYLSLQIEARVLSIIRNESALAEISKLDGCYVIKTNVPTNEASKEVIHERYKDLSQVEWAFRSMKTAHLELRPVHVRLESRTRAHVFVVMLSYILIKELHEKWKGLNITVEEGLRELDSLCSQTISIAGKITHQSIPTPRESVARLLQAAQITLPKTIPATFTSVATRKTLRKK